MKGTSDFEGCEALVKRIFDKNAPCLIEQCPLGCQWDVMGRWGRRKRKEGGLGHLDPMPGSNETHAQAKQIFGFCGGLQGGWRLPS